MFTETGHRSAIAFYGAMLIPIRRDQGRLHELLPILVQTSRAQVALPAIRAALCMVYADLDQPTDALEVVRHLAVDDFASITYDWLWLTTVALLADACLDLGDAGVAAELHRRLWPYRDQTVIIAHGIASLGPVGPRLAALSRLNPNAAASTWAHPTEAA